MFSELETWAPCTTNIIIITTNITTTQLLPIIINLATTDRAQALSLFALPASSTGSYLPSRHPQMGPNGFQMEHLIANMINQQPYQQGTSICQCDVVEVTC